MSLYWGDDPAHTVARPVSDRQAAVCEAERLIAAAARAYRQPPEPPHYGRSTPILTGDGFYEPRPAAPDEWWRGPLTFVVTGAGCVAGCVAYWYVAMWILPVVGEWIHRTWR